MQEITPVVFLSGPISGAPNAAENFKKYADMLEGEGARVLNPMALPPGLTQAAYMDICCAYLRSAHRVFMLPGWTTSAGAVAEHALAVKLGLPIGGAGM